MEDNYYKMLNFITRLSKPKLSVDALKKYSELDETTGEDALDIFESGIDNAESIIAIEARRLLKDIFSGPVDTSVFIIKPRQKIQNEEETIKALYFAHGGNVSKMAKESGIPIRTIYKAMTRHGLSRRKYTGKEVSYE